MHKYRNLSDKELDELSQLIDKKLGQGLSPQTVMWSVAMDGYDEDKLQEIIEQRYLLKEASENELGTGLLTRMVMWFYSYFRDYNFWVSLLMLVMVAVGLNWLWNSWKFRPVVLYDNTQVVHSQPSKRRLNLSLEIEKLESIEPGDWVQETINDVFPGKVATNYEVLWKLVNWNKAEGLHRVTVNDFSGFSNQGYYLKLESENEYWSVRLADVAMEELGQWSLYDIPDELFRVYVTTGGVDELVDLLRKQQGIELVDEKVTGLVEAQTASLYRVEWSKVGTEVDLNPELEKFIESIQSLTDNFETIRIWMWLAEDNQQLLAIRIVLGESNQMVNGLRLEEIEIDLVL